MKKISRSYYLQALGLLTLIRSQKEQLEYSVKTLAVLLNEPQDFPGSNYYGHVSDAVWEEYSIDRLLELLGMEVEVEVDEVRDG